MGLRGLGGGLGKLVGSVLQSPLERERKFHRRYRELSRQIDETPDNVTVYVLRGELNLERGKYDMAKSDFESALALAESLDDAKGWLVVEQVVRDRALYGLKLAERQL